MLSLHPIGQVGSPAPQQWDTAVSRCSIPLGQLLDPWDIPAGRLARQKRPLFCDLAPQWSRTQAHTVPVSCVVQQWRCAFDLRSSVLFLSSFAIRANPLRSAFGERQDDVAVDDQVSTGHSAIIHSIAHDYYGKRLVTCSSDKVPLPCAEGAKSDDLSADHV